jgi:hypothetical protein
MVLQLASDGDGARCPVRVKSSLDGPETPLPSRHVGFVPKADFPGGSGRARVDRAVGQLGILPPCGCCAVVDALCFYF